MAADIAFYLAVMYHFCPAVILVAIGTVQLGRIVVNGMEVTLVALGQGIDDGERAAAANEAAHHDGSAIRNEIDSLLRSDDLVFHRILRVSL